MRPFDSTRQIGFTLIEMLAVLTLMAIMAGIALPAMQRWFDSVSQRSQLTEVAVQFQRLASRAALLSQTVTLTRATWQEKLGDGEPALALPEGWLIISDQPMNFFYSGACDGGNVDLLDPNKNKVRLKIAAVSCEVYIEK